MGHRLALFLRIRTLFIMHLMIPQSSTTLRRAVCGQSVEVVAAASQAACAYVALHSPEAMKFKASGIAVKFVSFSILVHLEITSLAGMARL